jgi:hypothetical protein
VTGLKDEVTGSTDIAGLTAWILKLKIPLDIEIHTTYIMIRWIILTEEQRNMSVRSLLCVYPSREGERNK